MWPDAREQRRSPFGEREALAPPDGRCSRSSSPRRSRWPASCSSRGRSSASPSRRRRRASRPGRARAARLLEERDRALAALKELEFDHRTGKVSDADYRRAVGRLRAEAAAALQASTSKRVGRAGRAARGDAPECSNCGAEVPRKAASPPVWAAMHEPAVRGRGGSLGLPGRPSRPAAHGDGDRAGVGGVILKAGGVWAWGVVALLVAAVPSSFRPGDRGKVNDFRYRAGPRSRSLLPFVAAARSRSLLARRELAGSRPTGAASTSILAEPCTRTTKAGREGRSDGPRGRRRAHPGEGGRDRDPDP